MSGQNGLIIETPYGKIKGFEHNGARNFLGVRYGDDTSGPNRFQAPRPPKSWAGIMDTLTIGNAAPQCPVPQNTDPFYSWYSAITQVSEDCLFLNVFAPARSGHKRPVLLWIHGGGWREYSGGAPGFNASRLADDQDVVVVSINHRLTAFGFMPSDESGHFNQSSNAGLLDIVAALQWVKETISQFGGDPDNVTIFGESGGASKIAAILSMKSAKGLFQKAIIQSSAGGMQLATHTDIARAFHDLAQALERPQLTLEHLQTLPMATILAALTKVKSTFRGSIDEHEFFRHPYHGEGPDVSIHVPVLAGCTQHEATYHLRPVAANFSLPLTEVKKRLVRFLETDMTDVETIIASYQSHSSGLDPTSLLIAITTDFIFKRNTYEIAALQADKSQAPVYTYLFERGSPIERGRMGATHTSEIPFIFGTVDQAQACVGSPGEKDVIPLTKVMMSTWGAFARSGNPNTDYVPAWRAFKRSDPATMGLNVDSHSLADPRSGGCAALAHLPYFGYNHGLKDLVHG